MTVQAQTQHSSAVLVAPKPRVDTWLNRTSTLVMIAATLLGMLIGCIGWLFRVEYSQRDHAAFAVRAERRLDAVEKDASDQGKNLISISTDVRWIREHLARYPPRSPP